MMLNIITVILSVLGIYGFFNSIYVLTYLGAVAVLFEAFIGLYTKQLRGVSMYIISMLVGVFLIKNFFLGASLGLCFDSIITSVIGYIILFIRTRK